MIEKTVYNYLKSELDVPVVTEEQNDTKPPFVRIERTGGGESDYILTSMFAIQSYAKSLFEAAELNEKVKGAMKKITALDEVCKCELNSDYNYTDQTRKRYRYQAVFDITHY